MPQENQRTIPMILSKCSGRSFIAVSFSTFHEGNHRERPLLRVGGAEGDAQDPHQLTSVMLAQWVIETVTEKSVVTKATCKVQIKPRSSSQRKGTETSTGKPAEGDAQDGHQVYLNTVAVSHPQQKNAMHPTKNQKNCEAAGRQVDKVDVQQVQDFDRLTKVDRHDGTCEKK